MSDLTPQEAAKEILERVDRQYSGHIVALNDAEISFLHKIASGEYAPVVHGRWIYKDCNGVQTENHGLVAYAECSNCGREIHNVDREAATCPSCGAVMLEDEHVKK